MKYYNEKAFYHSKCGLVFPISSFTDNWVLKEMEEYAVSIREGL